MLNHFNNICFFFSSSIGTIIHHTQASVVQSQPLPAATNPILNRVAPPQIRQSLHMSPAKSSLSHVVIQQRQIVPPTTQQKTTTPPNVVTNRTSSVVVPPTSKPNESDPKHVDSETTIASNTLITQLPQTTKQIVFETKLPSKIDIKEDKPSKCDTVQAVSPNSIKLTESSKPDELPAATTSVIKNILSKPEEIKVKEEVKESASLKEDSEYWSAKEVNIESVIKKVDALCKTDDEASVESKVIVKQETPKIETTEDTTEKTDAKSDVSKTDTKNPNKREKSGRNKKVQPVEIEQQKSPPTPVVVAPEVPSGVQTRRGVQTKPAVQTKRGRSNRNASPRSKPGASTTIGTETKPRNTISESDIYEFHEDSGEENVPAPSTEPTRTRALSISKPLPSTQPSSPNTPQVEPSKAQSVVVTTPTPTLTTAPTTTPAIVSIPAPTAAPAQAPAPAPEPETKPVQSPEVEKSSEPQDDNKEDMAALNSLRKSRRLIERDGSRNTVDDIIEDVVKNMSKEQSVITSSASTAQSQSTSTQAQPRRSTRSTTNQTAVKLTVNEKTDLRKSPRPTRNTKDIKTSEVESAAEEKVDETSRIESREDSHEEKRDNDSEATQSASESGETSRIEVTKPETKVVEEPKTHTVVVTKEAPPKEVEKKQSQPKSSDPTPSVSQTLIDPVTGELTVVQQSNEGQYVAVSSHSGEFVKQPSVLVTTRPIVEPTPTQTIVSKVSTAPVVTIVSKPVPISMPPSAPVQVPVSVPVSMPISMPTPVPVPTTATIHVPKTTVVITSKPIEPPTHTVPLSMSIEKTLAQSSPQPQIQIQPVVQPPPPPHHSLKAHVLSSQHVKVSQAPVISSTGTPVILSTSVPSVAHMPNVQPVIKSTSIIHSSVVQPNIPSHKYGGKESPATVIAQQPQYQPKIQVSVAQPLQPQSQPTLQQQQQPQVLPQPTIAHLPPAHKNTLIVNIPTSSPANVPAAHSPRHSPNIPAKITHAPASLAHEPQYSIHVPKHSVANIHQPPIMSQKPVVIHSNKMHMPPTSSNYTSVVQCSGKVIQTPPPPHHLTQSAQLVQMGPAPVPLQHISQPQPTKSTASHQISIQSTQPSPYVSNVPLQVRTATSKYESAPSPKYKQHILPPNISQMQSQSASITQQQQSVAKQTTFPPQSMPTSNQIRLHQASQIMTGAVASPPPKQPHLSSQPIVAGKNFAFFSSNNQI